MGPLNGLKVIEIAAVGPGPFCGMLLADYGADILRIDRASGNTVSADIEFDLTKDIASRGRRSLTVDLKNPKAAAFLLELIDKADVLLEGFRPGVMERLGLAPELCLRRNPKLVYGRITGWGQTGPLAPRAGHDINFIGLSGLLATVGRAGEKPVIPVNYAGDFGGGGMLLAVGVLAAVIEARASGKGQIVDASMTEGSSLLMAMHHSMREMGVVTEARGVNTGDGGAHFYDTYETADGKYMAAGSAEPQFYRLLVEKLELPAEYLHGQMDTSQWAERKIAVAAAFKRKTQAQWCAIFDELDACVTPVLEPRFAHEHPHHKAREAFVTLGGMVQPAPAPRFSRTPAEITRPSPALGEGGAQALEEWGVAGERIADERRNGVFGRVA